MPRDHLALNLTMREASKASLAAAKEGLSRDVPIIDALGGGSADLDPDAEVEQDRGAHLRFWVRRDAAETVAEKCLAHSERRRANGHTNAAKTYHAIGQKITNQLQRQP